MQKNREQKFKGHNEGKKKERVKKEGIKKEGKENQA